MNEESKISITIYNWKGIDRQGKKLRGQTTAENDLVVQTQLQEQGIDIEYIKEQPKWITQLNKKPISSKHIVVFARQMATMINAGVPLVQSLKIVAEGVESYNMQVLILEIHLDISSGMSFSDAISKHPKVFDNLFLSLIRAGETSGTLSRILEEIASYLERVEMLKARVKKALFYPITMFVIAVAIGAMLLVFVVPQFEELFDKFDKELPMATQVVIGLSNSIQEQWWMYLLGFIIAMTAYKIAKRKSEKFCYFMDKFKLHTIIFGKILSKSIIARSCRTLAITIGAGIPFVKALDSVADVAGNRVYKQGLETVKDRVIEGMPITKAVMETRLFPNMVAQMISVGEMSGELEKMLFKISDYYDEQVKSMVDGMSTLIEPIMLVILGGMIGGFVLTMYMPIFELGSAVG